MGDPETSEESTDTEASTATQRLAFDKSFEKEIPQFLKKGKAPVSEESEPEEENDPDNLEPEDSDPISTDNETENEEMDQLVTGNKLSKSTKGGVVSKDLADLTAEMTIEQLKKQQEEIERRIKEKQSNEKQAVIDQVVNVVQQYGIPIDELVEALGGMKLRRKGTKAKAKYRDPATGNTWSGRGKEPLWIKGQADRTPFEI